jgi:hypothetical protein
VSSYEGPMEMMSDPEMVPLLNECVEFVRYHSTPEAEDTEEWHEFKERMLAGRPETFDILQSVWERYQTHLNQQNRTSLLRQLEKPEPTPDPRDIQESLEEDPTRPFTSYTRAQCARSRIHTGVGAELSGTCASET